MRAVWNIRDLRLILLGQLSGVMGTTLNMVAMTWMAWELTGGVFASGVVMTGLALPGVLLSVPAGKLDRYVSPVRLLVLTQAASAAVLGVLTVLMSGTPPVAVLYAASCLLGILTAVSRPCRASMLASFAGEHMDDTMRANSLTFNISALVGPAVGGVLLATVGGLWVSGISAVLVGVQTAIMLFVTDPGKLAKPESGKHVGLIEIISGNSELRRVLAVVAAASLLCPTLPLPFVGLVGDTFSMDAKWYGALSALVGVGSVIGAVAMKRLVKELVPSTVVISSVGIGASCILMGSSPWVAPVAALAVVAGVFMVMFYTSAMSVLSKLSGTGTAQVMGLYYVLTAGFPVKLFIGWSADMWGARSPFLILGAASAVGAWVMYMVLGREMHPVDVRKR